MRKLYNVVFNRKIVLKGQSFVAFAVVIFVAQVIFLIKNVVSFPPPSSLDALIALLRPDYRFHP